MIDMPKSPTKKRGVRKQKPQATELPFITYLSSLGHEQLRVKKPIPVTIRPEGEDFVATFFDAAISTSGSSPQEGVSNLQSLIADMFLIHDADRTSIRGPLMKKQHAVVQEFVCRK